jgi:hypothetical protein
MPTTKEVIDGTFCHREGGKVIRAQRVFHVSSLETSGCEQHAEAIQECAIPDGDLYPDETDVNGAIANNFQTQPLGVGQMRVIVGYSLPFSADFYPKLERSVTMQPVSARFLPDGTPLRFAADGDFPEGWVTGTFLTPVTQLDITYVGNSDIGDDIKNAKGTVNNAAWEDLGIGHWLFAGWSEQRSPVITERGYVLRFYGREEENWATWFARNNPATGLPYEGGSAAGISADYAYGVQISTDKLVMRIGRHAVADFATLFDDIIALAGG